MPSVKARPEEAPLAPWSPLPLTEIVILLGMILAAIGFFAASGDRRMVMIGGGIFLVSLSSAELAWREHLAGYRSHTMLLAGIPAVAVAGLAWLAAREWALWPQRAVPFFALPVFAVAAWRLRELFKRRSGGLGFRA